MNTKYGRLTNGRIEYAPSSLDTEDGVKMNPSEASYLAAGWKKVVDVKPTAEPGCRIEVSGRSPHARRNRSEHQREAPGWKHRPH